VEPAVLALPATSFAFNPRDAYPDALVHHRDASHSHVQDVARQRNRQWISWRSTMR
jgi:hypothetical protein